MRNIPSIFEKDKVTKMNLLFKISDVAQLVQKLERSFDRNFDLTKSFFSFSLFADSTNDDSNEFDLQRT
jgi:hypothetical protein